MVRISLVYGTALCARPAVPCEIGVNHGEAYLTGVAPEDGTGVSSQVYPVEFVY
jgi:hypothetical protein